MFNADGKITDAHDVKVAMTNASVFAYVADGKTECTFCNSRRPKQWRHTQALARARNHA
jgi:hypothetical protein